MRESRKLFFPKLLQTFIFHRAKFCLSQILATGPKLTINLRYRCKIFHIKTKHSAPPIFCFWKLSFILFCFDFAMFVSCVFDKFVVFVTFFFKIFINNFSESSFLSFSFFPSFSHSFFPFCDILFHRCFTSYFGKFLLYLWTFFFHRSSHIRWTFR